MKLNPYKEMDLKDQGLNQLNLDHDATIQSDTNVTLDDTKETEYKQKSKIKPKKGQWLVKLHKLLKCEICSKHFENEKYL